MTTTTTKSPRPSAARRSSTKMDPRIRARRVAVQRGEGRRRLRRLLILVVIAGVVGVGYLITRSPLLDVDHVRVSGAERSGVDAIVAMSGLDRGIPMTDAPVSEAHDRIVALPWVESVDVERHWPGTIEIDVTERVAVAAVQQPDGAFHLVDADGWVLAAIEGAPADLPVIAIDAAAAAPGTQQSGIAAPLTVGRLLTPDLRQWVHALLPAPDGTVDLRLHDGMRVDLGTGAHLSDKLIDVATVLARVDLTAIETIDVSVVHNPVVTRKQV